MNLGSLVGGSGQEVRCGKRLGAVDLAVYWLGPYWFGASGLSAVLTAQTFQNRTPRYKPLLRFLQGGQLRVDPVTQLLSGGCRQSFSEFLPVRAARASRRSGFTVVVTRSRHLRLLRFKRSVAGQGL